MTTTTVLSDDTATIVQEDANRFNWGAVVAGALIAATVTFFLISIGAGLGLSLTSTRNATASGIKAFLGLGAIYFIAAQAFGFAVGGYITGRLLGTPARESEEEAFIADAHGLAVWALAVVFGLTLTIVTATAVGAGAASNASTPVAYWADRLLRAAPGANIGQSPATATDAAPSSSALSGPATTEPAALTARPAASVSLSDAKEEAARLLTVSASGSDAKGEDHRALVHLVSQFAGLSGSAASQRVDAVETDMRAKAKDAADAARKAASYVAIWTALALLFGAVVCVAATVAARLKDDRDIFGRARSLGRTE